MIWSHFGFHTLRAAKEFKAMPAGLQYFNLVFWKNRRTFSFCCRGTLIRVTFMATPTSLNNDDGRQVEFGRTPDNEITAVTLNEIANNTNNYNNVVYNSVSTQRGHIFAMILKPVKSCNGRTSVLF